MSNSDTKINKHHFQKGVSEFDDLIPEGRIYWWMSERCHVSYNDDPDECVSDRAIVEAYQERRIPWGSIECPICGHDEPLILIKRGGFGVE